MATLTGYVSAVAAAAREAAGAEGLAVAAPQDGVVEDRAPAPERPTPMAAEEVKVARGAQVGVLKDAASAHEPKMERKETPVPTGGLNKQGPSTRTDEPVDRPTPRTVQAEPEVLRVQGASPRDDEAQAPQPTARARDELVGSDVGRGAGPRSVEVVLHAADDLTAVIAESDEVREAILRTVADVMLER